MNQSNGKPNKSYVDQRKEFYDKPMQESPHENHISQILEYHGKLKKTK